MTVVEITRFAVLGCGLAILAYLVLGPWLGGRRFARAIAAGNDRAAGVYAFLAAGMGHPPAVKRSPKSSPE